MSTYAIGQLSINNPDWMPEYTKRIAPLFAEYGAEVIAKEKPQVLEGDNILADIQLIIRFDNEERAKAWYNSEENQALIALRQQGSEFQLTLINGL